MCYHSQNSNVNINLLYCLSDTNHRLAKSVCKIFVVALAFSDCKLVVKFVVFLTIFINKCLNYFFLLLVTH